MIVLTLLRKFWWIPALVVLGIGTVYVIRSYNKAQQEVAVSKQVIKQQEVIINDTKTVIEARNDISNASDTTKYCQCLRSSRTPASCQRFLPAQYADNGKPAPGCDKPVRPD